ncbi:MAG: RNA polymerase sigma factor [Gemmatimonadaceae bacterium]
MSEEVADEMDGDSERPKRDLEYWQGLGDRTLVAALRDGEVEAVDEFIRRFEELVMRYARWLRIPREDQSHWVGEVLYDVALTLSRGRGQPPRHLSAYVTAACKYKARRERANETRYHTRVRDAAEEVAGAGEYAAIDASSQASIRFARGPGWEVPPLSPVLQRLIAAFDEELSSDDRQLLSWLGQQVSYTTIASWSGISRPAAVSRIQRLRERLTRVLIRFAKAARDSDRAELIRFLRRWGALDEASITTLESHRAEGEAND